MGIISDSEREDFQKILHKHGHKEDDFKLTENKPSYSSKEGGSVTGIISIKRFSTGKQKSYKAGHGSAWPTEFADDLEAGFYNK